MAPKHKPRKRLYPPLLYAPQSHRCFGLYVSGEHSQTRTNSISTCYLLPDSLDPVRFSNLQRVKVYHSGETSSLAHVAGLAFQQQPGMPEYCPTDLKRRSALCLATAKDFCNLPLAGAQQTQRQQTRHSEDSTAKAQSCCASEPAERPRCSSRHSHGSGGLRALFPECKFLHAQASFYNLLSIWRLLSV